MAAHSPQMETLRPELVAALAEMRPQPASIPVYSTVEPTRQPAFDAEYWGRNLRQPVLFAEAVQRALADGLDTFIELSPHPILLQPIAQAASGERQSAIVTAPSLRREADEPLTLLASLGTLYASGYAVDWQRVYPAGQVVSLPTYPWQRERFWIDQSAAQPTSQDAATGRLGAHIESASQPGAHLWNVQLDLATMPYLADHRVANGIVLPAAAYVDMALQAATEILGSNVALEQVSLQEMLVLSDKPIAVQIVLSPDTPGANGSSSAWSFRIFSRSASQWTLHAAGTLRPTSAQAQIAQDTPQVIQARSDALAATEHYRAMTRRRLDYGPAFQGILQMWRGPNEALSRVRLPESLRADDHAIHPSLLDAALQTLLAAHVAHPRDTYLPVGVDALQLHARPESELWVHATLTHDAADAFEGDVRLLDEAGQIVLEARGVRFQRAARDQRSSLDELFYQVQWVKAQLDSSPDQDVSGKWLIFADTSSVRQALVDQLRARGAACVIVTTGQAYQRIASDCYQIDPLRAEDFSRLLSAVSGEDKSALRGVVHLWSLDAAGSAFDDAHSLSIGVLHLTQALVQTSGSPRLWLVTRNAHPTNQPSNPAERGAGSQPINQSVDPLQSSVWGLGGVIAHEHSELRCTRIDLSASPSSAEIPTLLAELITDSRHDQIAVRDDGRYVARLARAAPASTPDIQSKSTPFKVETTQPGVLENLLARAAPRTRPAPGQVEIEVRATGLNFMNVMSALGVLPGYAKGVGPLGIECAGVIVSVGDGVEEVHVGDEIVAIAFDSLGTHAVTDARLVYPKPGWLSFEQAATIPIAFITAYYALHTLAHVQRGERVLIHAAAGGVGLAAVQIAQHLNAEIFATAGSAEKREFLRGLGVQHVLDSRSLAFADEVLALTAGRGVDAVLNSLAGAAMTKSLATLAPYGRFLEIGKRDIYQDTPVGLSPFQKNLSYFAIDLDRMSRERPAVVGGLLREVMQLVESGVLSPLPLRVFPVADVVEAFRHMAQAKHIGKIVIAQPALQPDGTLIIHPPARPVLASDATYLITGGLGALGLAVAQRLVELGARQLVLVGRSGAAHLSDSARQSLERIERQGARVVIAQADVANHDELAAVFDQIKQSLPPLRGVIHAAGILDDGILLQQTAERFQAVLSPKVRGAYNLHQLTRHAPLDFFVMFSSIAATLGTPGQSSYAAANAFLDGLAHHRRALGLPALSINWGPWGAIGLAAQGDRVERLAEQGIDSLTPDEGLNVFERLLRCGDAQLAVMPFDARQWRDAHPMDAPLLHDLLGATAESSRTTAATIGVRETLLAAEPGHRRRTILETYLQEQAAQVLRIAPSRIDPHKSLRTLGMDSLMTIELRNRIGAGLGLKLSATLVWNYPTVAGLAPYLAKEMGIPLEQDAPVAAAVELAQTGVDLDQLSTTEVEALLADELNAIDKFLK
ncbi:MAG TPA: SDR family NAD(P)-dependent oxidoreductase [Anaerolineae bacterium]|nr:SDR family NAD(P)-dependent oxidoreductase [Anaerolineae bacterium]